ncbi:protein kinase [Nannocystis sp. ILAH1]|uniref:protein kinase domain-containing protein n=1 Tax=Nannocystis sp. ILAH1 TaxID=2996789 RepID=UPI00226ED736|nr:protein kinase [Nannocystis sp. ILAH1]MCY0986305.1 protein kinase [Nannocystis sp. ILAH1]
MNAAAGNPRDLASLVGTVLDGTYRLDQLIGEGGMGAVFRGRHVIMMRDVAIKVLHPDFNRDPELVRRFDREAQSAARLDHPNCIHVSAYGTTEDGMRYLVMQLLEGVELADLLTEPTAPKRVVEWSIQILRGLEHAHSQGVIHRDLKPQNVFLTRDAHGNQPRAAVPRRPHRPRRARALPQQHVAQGPRRHLRPADRHRLRHHRHRHAWRFTKEQAREVFKLDQITTSQSEH